MANEITFEAFAVGKWNGMTFTAKDLIEIATNFDKLSEYLKVPLKFGHNDEQPITDGQPALGWVDMVWYNETSKKLLVKAVDVPDVVFNAIKKKLYNAVSIELSKDVEHKGTFYGAVLTGVALLGAEIPAVSTLASLSEYLTASKEANLARELMQRDDAVQHFSAITYEEEDMADDIKTLSAQMATMMKRQEALEQSNTELQSENATLKAEREAFAKKEKERVEAEAKSKIELARKKVNDILETAVKEEHILPAQREQFTKLFRVDDDDAVVAIDTDLLTNMVNESRADFHKGSVAKSGSKDKETNQTPDELITDKVNKLLIDGKVKTFSAGMDYVLSTDRELAMAYRDHNDQ